MKDYVLNEKPEPASNEMVWAFDLGKGSIGEAVRRGNEFLHKASLLIPAEFAETKTAAGRRRMFRTREAHKAREKWLNEVMQAAGIEILKGRQIGKVDEQGNQIPKSEWKKKKGKWVQIAKGDYRLEREFPPRKFQKNKAGKLEPVVYPDGKAKDGAPAKTDEDFSTCYNSALLRIKLLRGEELKPWQVFKAFHSAMQKRGYGKVAWARREQKRLGKSEEEIEKALAKKDPAYREAVEAWPKFKQDVSDKRHHFPAYYDAAKMGLWKPGPPEVFLERTDCQAQSTRNVRFDRSDVEKEIRALVDGAAKHYRALTGKAEYLLYGPAGKAYASYYPDLREEHDLKEGGENDWQGVLGQKIPRFDNRIVNDCALLPRFQVCTVHFRFDGKGLPKPESLLHAEFAFLWKLKNLKFTRNGNEDRLTPNELKEIFDFPDTSCYRVETKTWGKFAKEFKWDDSCLPKPIKPAKGKPQSREKMVAWFAEQLAGIQVLRSDGTVEKLKLEEKASIFTDVLLRSYELTESRLAASLDDLGGKPLPAQKEVDAPKPKGRSRYSRPALRLLREFVLKGLPPDEFRRKQETKIPADADPKKGFVRDDLKSFCKERMGDSWQKAYVPNERLAMQVMRAGTTRTERDKAISELIAEQNDPIVRHRLSVFATRLHELEKVTKEKLPQFQAPDYVALEFVRDNLPESFLGQQAQTDYGAWARKRKDEAKEALEIVKQLGCESRDAVQKYLLLRAQGFQCVYFPNGTLNINATHQQLSDAPCIYTEQKIGLANLDDLVIDHIVPQQGGYNGPDAIVNKVVTTRHVNEQMKKCRIPFEWFQQDMPEKWAAYVKRVSSLHGTLGKKKVRLLTQADAPELVQKYTALAETAWISKLAQAILCIHFGWPFALDEERRRKITIISGGLTGRVRRMYDLNRVLNPNAETREEAEKKNRNDDRHHALDAMVISFIPGWARNEKKEGFFRFPDGVHREFFEKEIQSVKPRNIALQKPALEQKIYGQRTINGHKYIVGRESLASLAIKKTQNSESIKKKSDIEFGRIVDPRIQKDVQAFWESNPAATLEMWKKWCTNYRLGPNGPQVKFILVTKSKEDAVDEYKNVSKAGDSSKRGEYKRGAKHRGYFIYERPAPTRKEPNKMQIEVCPVFVFQSKKAVQENLMKQVGLKMHGYFESGCQVRTQREWEFQGKKYPADEFILGSVWANRNAELWHPVHQKIGPVGLRILLDAGFERI
jgi:CRISPR-associated endonuclease Csn1